MSHESTIDAARKAIDALLASELTPEQRQLVVDLTNVTQDLNTLYWDQIGKLEAMFTQLRKAHTQTLADLKRDVDRQVRYWNEGTRTAAEVRDALYGPINWFEDTE